MATGLHPVNDELDGWTLEPPNPAAKKPTHSNNDMSAAGSTNSPQHAADVRFSCNICFDAVTEPVVTACGHLYCWPCLFQWLEPGLLPHERVTLGILQHPFQQPTSHDASKRVCPVCKAPCSVQRIVPIYVRGNGNSNATRDKSRNDSVQNDTEIENNKASGEEELMDQEISDIEDEQEQDNLGVRTTTGLRLRFRSTDSHIPNSDHYSGSPTVPRRPAPQSPPLNSGEYDTLNHSTSSSPLRHTTTTLSPVLPRGPHPASLSHGMLPLMQHALLRASSDAAGGAPPLSRLERSRHGGDNTIDLDSAPDTTEFLSRLLLLLGSFVIFCLLLF